MKKYKIGLALGGGGSRGFAHLGVVKALKDKGIVPDIISGVSAGAIAGSLIADGKLPEEALKIIKSKGFSEYTKFVLPRKGLFSLEGLRKELEKSYSVKNIEDLKTPLFVGTTNLTKGVVEYHSKGLLKDYVIASASIPVLFEPVIINGDHYVDGGLLDNIPIKPLQNMCEKIIAVNLVPILEAKKITGFKQLIGRTIDLVVNSKIDEFKNSVDVLIEPKELRHHSFFSTKNADKVFEIGYNEAMKIDFSKFLN